MKKIFNEVVFLPEFKRDIKKLKRFRSLQEDMEVFIKVQLQSFHKLGIDNGGIVQIASIGIDCPKIYKARKFACKSLKDKGVASGIRVIYAYFEEYDRIEFIEIYYKGDKENEDKERISRYYKGNNGLNH